MEMRDAYDDDDDLLLLLLFLSSSMNYIMRTPINQPPKPIRNQLSDDAQMKMKGHGPTSHVGLDLLESHPHL